MRAAIFSPDGAERIAGEARFAAHDLTVPTQLAKDMLDRAPEAITLHFEGAGG